MFIFVRRGIAAFVLAFAALSAQARCDLPAHAGARHVPSPDWRDQIIYFVMIDRFDDGDASNDDQHAGEFDPRDPAKYSGGDLCGIARRLDYIQNLGATALWITPPVANQWWDGQIHYGGYHGYWAENFKKVDRHFGTLGDYRALAESLHGRGMFLVQDIVVNHVGNFFGYQDGWSADDPAAHVAPNEASVPHRQPTQKPFSRNDPRKAGDRAAAIYHWTPDITDFADPHQLTDYQLARLDDLNTENPIVRRALRDSYDYWIREVGVDAYRVDTAFYVPPDYFRDFLYADDTKAPGILRTAEATGRKQFHVFGEGFGLEKPFDDTQSRRIDAYQRDAAGPLLPGMINFPLYGTALDVFARGHPTAELAHRLRAMNERAGDAHLMPSFLDNHDVDRFLAGADADALRQALLMLFTVPGIPVIYYGTEQEYTMQRGAMFAGGVQANGRDHFDEKAPLYRYLQRVTALRSAHRVLSRGALSVLADNTAGAGGIAYRLDHESDTVLVALNTASTTSLLDRIVTRLPPGTRLTGLFAIDGVAEERVVDADGMLSLVLAPHAGFAWRIEGAVDPGTTAERQIAIDAMPDTVGESVEVTGHSRGAEKIQLVLDGDLDHAMPVTPTSDGRWSAHLDTSALVDATVTHRLVAWAPTQSLASEARSFHAAPQWRLVGAMDDPADDDRGPTGLYTYPRGGTWQGVHPLDIRHVDVFLAGKALRIDVRFADLLDSWNAPNGFDHLALTAFLQFPGRRDGVDVMPQQHGVLPNGMRWQWRARIGGWATTAFWSDGATADAEGRAVLPSPLLQVRREARTLQLVVPAASLPPGAGLDGATLYLATWDYDGGYRTLASDAGEFGFGGGSPEGLRVMDDVRIELSKLTGR